MGALGQQPDVGVAQQGRKAVSIVDDRGGWLGGDHACGPVHAELVHEARVAGGQFDAEDIGRAQALHRGDHRAVAPVEQFHRQGAGQHRVHRQASGLLVHAQHTEGVGVLSCLQRPDLVVGHVFVYSLIG